VRHFNPKPSQIELEELMSKKKDLQFRRLKYLYMGTSNVQKDVDYYTNVLGAKKIWDVSSFGTRVAAFQLGEGPILLLADHRPAPSCILIFQVDNLRAASAELRKKGWAPLGERFEVPEGPCYRFNDPSGNPFALLEITRPDVLGDHS
jgi:predicted enzyme related to lactoylglutathione lyase